MNAVGSSIQLISGVVGGFGGWLMNKFSLGPIGNSSSASLEEDSAVNSRLLTSGGAAAGASRWG
jgi:hypothetical protein